MRCDQCEHWKLDEFDWAISKAGFGKCKAIRERWRIQDEVSKDLEWGDDGSEYQECRNNALKIAKAAVQDGSDYMADLVTGPDFGCVLFKQKQG